MNDIQDWQVRKYELLEERGYQCELCGAISVPLELDHAILPRSKHRKGHSIPELNEPFNIIVTCQTCNQRKPEAYWSPFKSYSAWAWYRNCQRYGSEDMIDWLERVPLKIKPNFHKRDDSCLEQQDN